MRRAALILVWLVGGHAIAAACYAALITLPDANVLLLAASALSLLAGAAAWAITDATAVAWLVPGTPFGEAWRRALRRGIVAFVLAAGVFLLVWWTAGRAHEWYRAHATQVDAWMMATFDTTRTRWLHRAVAALHYMVRHIIGVALAASLLAAVVTDGVRSAFSGRWIAHALSRFHLGLVAGAMVALVAVPWRFVAWRPAALPATGVEAAFVVAKLVILVLLAHIAWGLVLFAASRRQP